MINLKAKDVEIYDLTLLSSEEYKKHKSLIPLIKDDWWWLRDPYPDYSRCVYCVSNDGVVDYCYCYYTIGVRPFCTLGILNPIDITIGDKIKFGSYIWTVLDVNSKEVKMLCNDLVDNGKNHKFDNNTNIWQKSQLFDWLNTEFLPLLSEQAK